MPPTGSALSRYLVKALILVVLAAVVVLLATAIWASASAHTHRYVYRVRVSDGWVSAADLQRTADVLSARVKALRRSFKLSRWSVTMLPTDGIELQIRTRADPVPAIAWLAMGGRVEFRLLHPRDDILNQLAPDELPAQYEVKIYRQKHYILSKPGELETVEHSYAVQREPALATAGFEQVTLETVGLHKMTVLTFYFNAEDARAFGSLTALNAGRKMAMLIDGEMFFPPKTIRSAVRSGVIQLQGFYYMPPLRKLVKVLDCGSLPGSLEELSHTVD